jgi:hypothetical protein
MASGAAPAVRRLRQLSQTRAPAPARAPDAAAADRCDLCGVAIDPEHRHLLHLVDRRILCSCEPCFAMRSGDAELRPSGTRVLLLDDLALDDDLWAKFQIPIGLAFFMRSSATGNVVGLYPSPAGATECDLDLDAWYRLLAANPVLEDLDPDAEALIVNRVAEPPIHAIAPLDDCYRLVGIVKATWEGITGGAEMEAAVDRFFDGLRAVAKVR